MILHRFSRFETFPSGYSLLEKVRAYFYRISDCKHPDSIDLGDEDHQYLYCFRCASPL